GFDPGLAKTWHSKFEPVESLDSFSSCDFVIESVVEDLASKRNVFDQIEEIVGLKVPVGSNTSSIPITQLQQDRKNPGRFVGMHWAEPAHATRFLELIRGERTSVETFEKVVVLAKRLGKEPSIVQRDVPGFIVNRIGYAMYREAAHMVDQGVADVETIDRSCRNAFGLWAAMCGPFRWIDITGGPELYAKSIERVLPTLCSDNERLPELLERLKRDGAGGQPTGSGFYEYNPDSPDWQERYREFAWRAKALLDEFYPLDNQQETH
ncbi:MAG: 3-hydroxyacyl-CoA dehydrogenase family protein, partial [Verrucomicrobiota bacterium]|nr:3-hydroxyacyl-CoA dehydrogenase family protein [Verrucomicrobiota bacterium]